MFAAVLIAHITGAIVTGIAVLYSLYVLAKNDVPRMRPVFLTLGYLGAFEVATGVALALLSDFVTVASVCDNIAVYLILVGLVESALYAALKRTGSAVPVTAAISPTIGSLVLLTAGVLLGL